MDEDLVLIKNTVGVPDLHPGDIVRVAEGIGVVRYIGDVRFDKKSIWAGVELVEKLGFHDGVVGGKRYFKCKDGHGIFVETEKIRQKILPEELLERVTLLSADIRRYKRENEEMHDRVQRLEKRHREAGVDLRPDYLGNINMGDRVRLSNRKSGTVKYIGRTHFEAEQLYGIELDSWLANGHDGSKGGRRYFKCKPGYGYFVRKNMIVDVLEKKSAEDVDAEETLQPLIGDRVEIDRGRKGVVKFIGVVKFAQGVHVGIELDQWTAYGHDGKVKNYRYFTAQPGKGYFARLETVVRILGSSEGSGEEDLPPSLEHTQESVNYVKETVMRKRRDSLNELVLGDKVQLYRGKVGWVRYIGKVEFTSGEVIGLELDSWTDNGHDGTVKGKQYFSCPQGRGYFTKRSKIAEIVETFDSQVRQTPKGPEEFVFETKGREEEVEFDIGDRVKLSRGRTGVVRYIGRVRGMKTSGSSEKEVIGLELDLWSEKGHSGTHQGTTYFECKPGRGYWTSRGNVAQVLERNVDRHVHARKPSLSATLSIEPEREEELLDVHVGDLVLLSRGREGVIRYLGPIDGMKRKEIIGIELSTWSEKGHDGSYKGKQYFRCNDGRGYFTTRASVAKILKKGEVEEVPKRTKGEIDIKYEEPEIIEVSVGDRVLLSKGRIGTVQYKGRPNNQLILGLHLEQWDPKGNDGSLKNVKYFDCPPGHGYFAKPQAVKSILGSRDDNRRSRTYNRPRAASTPDRRPREPYKKAPKVNVGDHVRLKRGKTGHVAYIGKVAGSRETLIGLELDQWYEKGNDGSFRGESYFTVRGKGWGYFTRPESIDTVLNRANS